MFSPIICEIKIPNVRPDGNNTPISPVKLGGLISFIYIGTTVVIKPAEKFNISKIKKEHEVGT